MLRSAQWSIYCDEVAGKRKYSTNLLQMEKAQGPKPGAGNWALYPECKDQTIMLSRLCPPTSPCSSWFGLLQQHGFSLGDLSGNQSQKPIYSVSPQYQPTRERILRPHFDCPKSKWGLRIKVSINYFVPHSQKSPIMGTILCNILKTYEVKLQADIISYV